MEQLVKETLESCLDYLPKLIRAVSEIPEMLQSGNEAAGIRLLPPVFDGLQWVMEAIQGMQRNGFLREVDLGSLAKHFKELESALEIRDYVLIADLFEYEIEPVLEEWLKTIEQTGL